MNGAGSIHDYELARIGASTESVARYIRSGEFGLWRETGDLNDIIREAAELSLGLGENVGRRIEESTFPYKDLSIFAAAYRHSVPATVHVGIGYDIIHEHPNCDGAALGAASYHDFLIFTKTMEKMEGGIMLNFGSAIMGPEVYLKALSMVRNVAHQRGQAIKNFTTAVFDLVPIQGDIHHELPKTDPGYYFRPHKTDSGKDRGRRGRKFLFLWRSSRDRGGLAARPFGAATMTIPEILDGIKKLRALVVGDICLDRWCTYDPATSEPSAETGIPRLGIVASEVTPGGGGTVANNLAALRPAQGRGAGSSRRRWIWI